MRQQFVTLQQHYLWQQSQFRQQSQFGQQSQYVPAAALQHNSPSLMSLAQRLAPEVHAYAQAHHQYAAAILDAASAVVEEQKDRKSVV